jgi:hypothetical protein
LRFGKINELLIAPTGLINYVKCSVCTYRCSTVRQFTMREEGGCTQAEEGRRSRGRARSREEAGWE